MSNESYELQETIDCLDTIAEKLLLLDGEDPDLSSFIDDLGDLI